MAGGAGWWAEEGRGLLLSQSPWHLPSNHRTTELADRAESGATRAGKGEKGARRPKAPILARRLSECTFHGNLPTWSASMPQLAFRPAVPGTDSPKRGLFPKQHRGALWGLMNRKQLLPALTISQVWGPWRVAFPRITAEGKTDSRPRATTSRSRHGGMQPLPPTSGLGLSCPCTASTDSWPLEGDRFLL